MSIVLRPTRPGLGATATAMALCLAASAPALAQTLTATEAWEGLQAAATGAGLSLTTTGDTDQGGAVLAEGVRIAPVSDPNAVVVSMETLRIESRGERVALIPAPVIQIAARGHDRVTRRFEVTHDGEITGMVTPDSAALDLTFPRLAAEMQAAAAVTGKQVPASGERFSMVFDGLTASMNAEREGSAAVRIGAAQVSYDVAFTDHSSGRPEPVVMDGEITQPALVFDATELDMLSDAPGMLSRAFAAGLTAHLTFDNASSSGTSTQMLGGTPVTVTSTGGPSSMTFRLVDGRFDASLSGEAVQMDGTYGPIRGQAGLAGMAFDFGMPLVVTPDDQPARLAFRMEDLLLSPDLLTMFGAGEFAGDAVTLALDLGAQVRVVRELDLDVVDSEVPPFDLSGVTLNDLRLAVGDSEFTGTGAVTVIGGMLSQLHLDRPDAEGDFTFNLIGGERLLGRLQAMGVVPADQLFFVRMMLNGLGRSVGADHLVSDVAIRPGGLVTVNGAPLPF